MKKIIIIIIIILLAKAGILIYESNKLTKIQIEQERQARIDREIVIDRENRLLDCIAYLESKNNEKLIVLDWNNQYSYGSFQFQIVTIKDWYRRQGKTINTEEAIKIALDREKSRELARELILNGEIWRWKLTGNKIIAGKCKNFEPDEINNYIN